MTELKTLKEIELKPVVLRDTTKKDMKKQKWDLERGVKQFKDQLRQEAIKWIKDFQQINEDYRKLLVGDGEARMEKLDLFIDKCHEWFKKIDEKFPFLYRNCMTYNYEIPRGEEHLRRKINCEIMYQGMRMTYITLMHIFNIEDEDLK